MKFRLSNGYSYSVPFSAATASEFRLRAGSAYSEYRAAGNGPRAELHVATDSGEWISPLYPRSNGPVVIGGLLEIGRAAELLSVAAKSNRAGTWFEHEIAGLSAWSCDDA